MASKITKTTGNRALDEDVRRLYQGQTDLTNQIAAIKPSTSTVGQQGPPGPPGPAGPAGPSGTASLFYVDGSVPAGNTVANTNAEVAFASQVSLVGPVLPVGSVFRITLRGVFTRAAALATVEIRVYVGTVLILDSGTLTIAGPETNVGFGLMGEFMITATGSSGTIEAQGDTYFETSGTTGVAPIGNPAPFTVDLSVSETLKSTIQFSVADPANSATLRLMIVERLQ